MMIYSENASDLANRYAEFMLYLVQARWYFGGHFADKTEQYAEVFESLKTAFKGLNSHYPVYAQGTKLLDQMEQIFQKNKKLSDDNIQEISNILYEFINHEERTFRNAYFASQLAVIEKDLYTPEFHNQVGALLASGKYDASVVTAFKFLDNQLQTALKVSPTQYYGEEMVNYAFAPNAGKLQLNTHSNEQVGLRNFFSGANALFRNPSAHRFVNFDKFSANAIIAMTGMMAKLTKSLIANYRRKQKKSDNQS